jgi:hypothetical protein
MPRTSTIALVPSYHDPRTSTDSLVNTGPFHVPRTSTLSLVISGPPVPHALVAQTDARVETGDDDQGGDYLAFSIGETSSKAFEL